MSQASLFDRWGAPATQGQSAPAAAPLRNRAPMAANADPATSHIAADSFMRSGRRDALNRRVLEFLGSCRTPRTFHEIARAIGLEDHACMKRLNDLRRLSLVKHCPSRVDPFSGRECLTWALAGAVVTDNQVTEAKPERRDRQQQAASAPAQEPAPDPETCERCAGAGIICVDNHPDVYQWCDYAKGESCTAAEKQRATNPREVEESNAAALKTHRLSPASHSAGAAR